MNRRQFGAVSASGAALAAIAQAALGQERRLEKDVANIEQHKMFRVCAQACSDCQRECDSCSTHCAHQLLAGNKDHMKTLMTCQDCADFCVAAAQIVARGGPFAGLICGACADACGRCGKECEKFAKDEHMKRCTEECRKCEKACRDMVKHIGQPSGR
jgi:hypothetical protein